MAMNKYISGLILSLCFCTPAVADCSKTDNYVAQYKVREILNKDLFEFDGMTSTQLGNEHWFITKRLYPWSDKIKDACVRSEVKDYLFAELNYMQDYILDQKKPKNQRQDLDEETYQGLGHQKKEAMSWPEIN